MFVFKTSGATYDSVIANQMHAFLSAPKDWDIGEMVLVSKNKADLRKGEKQINYVMRIEDIRSASQDELASSGPGIGAGGVIWLSATTRQSSLFRSILTIF